MKIFRTPCCIQIPSRPVSCTGGWVQLIAEKENWQLLRCLLFIVVQLRRTLLLHHSCAMWPI